MINCPSGFAGVITFNGYDNRIDIGKCISAMDIICSDGAEVYINSGVRTNGKIIISCTEGGYINIGGNGYFGEDSSIWCKGGFCSFGDNVSIGERFFSVISMGDKLKIGNDCLLSKDVTVLPSDGHSVFSQEQKINLSSFLNSVEIADHVWIGKGVSVLKNTFIGKDSIIGVNSVVKGNFDAKTVIVGNPAKVIRRGCNWDMQDCLQYDQWI